jgi:hypothetical protein
MRRGDIVSLRKPLCINEGYIEKFTHGIIAARIKSETEPLQVKFPDAKAPVKELIIYLYNPETCKICLDEGGFPILFDLQLDELRQSKNIMMKFFQEKVTEHHLY